MNRCCVAALFSALSAVCLYGVINAPSPGFVRYGGMPIQRLYGVSGNMVLSGSVFGVAGPVSFSDTAGLIATNGSLKLVKLDGSPVAEYRYVSQAAPLLGADVALNGAVAWMGDSGSVLWWDGKTFTTVTVESSAFEGRINCISLLHPNVARLLMTHPGGGVSAVDIALPTGNITSSDILPGVQGPAFQIGSRLLWSDERGLEIEIVGGAQHTLAAPAGRFTAEQMSSRWVHLYFPSNGTHWALHLGDREPALSRLPTLLARKEGQQ
jgi:hypothetical protein